MSIIPINRVSMIHKILWMFAAFALAFYAWLMFDLLAHPFDEGANAILAPFLFRWRSGFYGTVTVLMGMYITGKSTLAILLSTLLTAARREVLLDWLLTQMIGMMEKTVQPGQASVWLRDRKVQS